MDNIQYEYFEFMIDTPDTQYNQKFQLSKNVNKVLGLLISSDYEEMIYYRGRQRIELNGKEFFPQPYESKLLMTSLNIAPDMKYYTMGGVNPGDGIIKLSYKDTEHPRFTFTPYRVQLYVKCEIA